MELLCFFMFWLFHVLLLELVILPTLGMNDVNSILLFCFLFEQIASAGF